MPEPPEELLAAVQDQAEARVRADIQGYARYLTPEAIDSLRASFPGLPPRVAAYEIEKHASRGADYVFDVRYSARDESFVVRSRWRKLDEGWMVVHADRLWAESDRRPGIVSRLAARLLRGRRSRR
ncbi:MAG: hypothetical protein V3S20_11210 [Dehalococcoidia bacterium]